MSHSTPDLFAPTAGESGSPQSVLAELSTWFEAWLADANGSRRVRLSSSEEVYRAMWGGFVHWCVGQSPPVSLNSLTEDDLHRFVASRTSASSSTGELSPRYTWRVLNLIDRVLSFVARTLDSAPNKAAQRVIHNLGIHDVNMTEAGAPEHLPASEAKRLVTFLSDIRPRSISAGVPRTWQELRNRSAVALQLGAGLTPGDVRAITLAGVVTQGGFQQKLPWKLRVPADGSSPERETPVAQWAGQLLRLWIETREQRRIPGPWLFPSTLTGKPWSKTPHYLAVQQVLRDAQVDEVAGGSFRLRHTFALRQLRRGHSAADVARWMGIVDPDYMRRYLGVLQRPVDVV